MTEGMKCTCSVWQKHRMSLASLLAEAPFHYCPWCGQPLANDGQRDEVVVCKNVDHKQLLERKRMMLA